MDVELAMVTYDDPPGIWRIKVMRDEETVWVRELPKFSGSADDWEFIDAALAVGGFKHDGARWRHENGRFIVPIVRSR